MKHRFTLPYLEDDAPDVAGWARSHGWYVTEYVWANDRLPLRAGARTVLTVTLVPVPGAFPDHRVQITASSITTLNGPTQSEIRSTMPGAVALLDRWLAAHPNDPGGALIAKARELLTGRGNVPVHCVSCGAFLRSVHPLAVPESVTCAVCVGAKARTAADG